MMSMRSMTSLVNSDIASRAVMFSRTCAALDAPVMTEEMLAFFAHQASDNWVRLMPNSSAMIFKSPTFLLRPSSVNMPFNHS